jgi:hypothetical protein
MHFSLLSSLLCILLIRVNAIRPFTLRAMTVQKPLIAKYIDAKNYMLIDFVLENANPKVAYSCRIIDGSNTYSKSARHSGYLNSNLMIYSCKVEVNVDTANKPLTFQIYAKNNVIYEIGNIDLSHLNFEDILILYRNLFGVATIFDPVSYFLPAYKLQVIIGILLKGQKISLIVPQNQNHTYKVFDNLQHSKSAEQFIDNGFLNKSSHEAKNLLYLQSSQDLQRPTFVDNKNMTNIFVDDNSKQDERAIDNLATCKIISPAIFSNVRTRSTFSDIYDNVVQDVNFDELLKEIEGTLSDRKFNGKKDSELSSNDLNDLFGDLLKENIEVEVNQVACYTIEHLYNDKCPIVLIKNDSIFPFETSFSRYILISSKNGFFMVEANSGRLVHAIESSNSESLKPIKSL